MFSRGRHVFFYLYIIMLELYSKIPIFNAVSFTLTYIWGGGAGY